MLENWLQAPKVKIEELASWQLGTTILQHIGDQFPDLRTTNIALVGISEEADTIRKYLYQMAAPFSKFPIADVGNLRNSSEETLLPVLKELLESKIIPIVLSGEPAPFAAQYKAYQDRLEAVNLVVVDEKMAHHEDITDYLSVLRKNKQPKLANLGLIGYQTHLCPPESIHFFQNNNYDCVRLGTVKSNIEQIEPALRDAHLVYFNMAALKLAEAPGLWENSPSGFTSEEACKVCHYAGMSDKLSSIGFYGYCEEKDPQEQTAQLIAQMVWYTMEGIYVRKKDFPVSVEGMLEYIVALKEYDYEVTFWKSPKSGRWWIELPNKDSQQKKSHLIPCAYEDYQLACQDELSERLLNIIERFA